MPTKKILVTGGTGLLGSTLLWQILTENPAAKIRAIRRPNSRMDLVKNVENLIEWVDADILDIDSLTNALDGVTHVFHCAAMVSFSPSDAKKMKQVNVDGTANLVNLSIDQGIKKLVHVSSVAALGRVSGKDVVDENSRWESSSENSRYALTKMLGEMEVWRGIAEGLNAAIVNPAIILGNGFWDEGSIRFFKQINDGLNFYPPGGSGFVDAADVSRFMILLMNSEISTNRYVLCGQNMGYQLFFERIAHNLGKKPPRIAVNPWMAELAWRGSAVLKTLTGRPPLVTKETARNSMQTWIYDNKKSLTLPSFQYRPIEETIAECCQNFISENARVVIG